jgi:hypothetical protein
MESVPRLYNEDQLHELVRPELRLTVLARTNCNLPKKLKPVIRQSVGGWSQRLTVLSCTVSSWYLETTSEQAEDFMCNVIVLIYTV